jgi:hypothetical protein
MALTPDQQDRIIRTVRERVGSDLRCPLCGNTTWTATEGFAVIYGQERLDRSPTPDQGLPSIPLVCTRCGNTHFLNIFVLGVQDLFAERKES